MKRLWLSAALLLTAAGLSACGGSNNGGSTTVTPPAAAAFEDQFGSSGFGPSFRIGRNSEARDVASGDVVAINVTAEPVALP